MKKTFGIFIVFLLLYIGSYFIPKTGTAPDFKTQLINGNDFKLSNQRGKYVIVDFWASWCGPCRKDFPKLISIHNQYSDKITIVSIALEKNYDAGLQASKSLKFPWENQIIEEHATIYLSSIARQFGVTSIPAKFLINPDGKIMSNLSFEAIQEIIKQ